MRSATLQAAWLACLLVPRASLSTPPGRHAHGASLHQQPRNLLQLPANLLPVSYTNFSDPSFLTSLREFASLHTPDPQVEVLQLVPLHVTNLRNPAGTAEIRIPSMVNVQTDAVTTGAHMAQSDVDRIKAALGPNITAQGISPSSAGVAVSFEESMTIKGQPRDEAVGKNALQPLFSPHHMNFKLHLSSLAYIASLQSVTLWLPDFEGPISRSTAASELPMFQLDAGIRICIYNSTMVVQDCEQNTGFRVICWTATGAAAFTAEYFNNLGAYDLAGAYDIDCVSTRRQAQDISRDEADTLARAAIFGVPSALVLCALCLAGLCGLRRRRLKFLKEKETVATSNRGRKGMVVPGVPMGASIPSDSLLAASMAIAQAATLSSGTTDILPGASSLDSRPGAGSLDASYLSSTRGTDGVPLAVFKACEPIDTLLAQLDHVFNSGGLLCGRYVLDAPSERRVGGQGIVQFASARFGGKKFAIKFFPCSRRAFDVEAAFVICEELRHVLPEIEDVQDNADGLLQVLGRPLPPMLVLERGESLDEWQRRSAADFASAMLIIKNLVDRLETVHAAGIAHRDMKPSNVILYPKRNAWTIIDFGGAARIGTVAPITCTLAYAAPETVQAIERGERTMAATLAVDVWALGVMGYELLTQTRVFQSASRLQITQTMAGERLLPWEDTGGADFSRNEGRLGWMRATIHAMLTRDPVARVAMREVARQWRVQMQMNTTDQAPSESGSSCLD